MVINRMCQKVRYLIGASFTHIIIVIVAAIVVTVFYYLSWDDIMRSVKAAVLSYKCECKMCKNLSSKLLYNLLQPMCYNVILRLIFQIVIPDLDYSNFGRN